VAITMTTFRSGQVLGTTLRLWAKNLVPVVLITTLLHSPLILWTLSVAQHEMVVRQLVLLEYTAGLVALPVNLLVSALLACGVVAELEGRPLSLGGWLMSAVTRFVTAVIAIILVSLCIGGITLIIAIPFSFHFPIVALVLVSLSMLYLCAVWYAAGPVSVIEGTGSFAALGRGRALTKGHRLAIVCFLILWVVVARGLELLELVLTFDRIGGPSTLGTYLYIDLIREVLLGSLGGVMTGVVYYFLRAERDGTSPQQLATVFE
jgi:hypothetical protein